MAWTTDLAAALKELRQPPKFFPMAKFYACPNCGRALSIGEVIEFHCENCNGYIEPEDVRVAA